MPLECDLLCSVMLVQHEARHSIAASIYCCASAGLECGVVLLILETEYHVTQLWRRCGFVRHLELQHEVIKSTGAVTYRATLATERKELRAVRTDQFVPGRIPIWWKV